jgi:thymidine kinase
MMDITNLKSGYLELFIGPMFSGKTEKLLNLHKKFMFCNIQVMVINHLNDSERHVKTNLVSHDNNLIGCKSINSLVDINNNIELTNEYNNARVIMINEGQFFNDIVDFVANSLSDGKIIYISGLDGDFKHNKFGDLLNLIPICDKVTKLNAMCGECKNGTPAIFSHRKTHSLEQTIIGGNDHYIPVCRNCYYTM